MGPWIAWHNTLPSHHTGFIWNLHIIVFLGGGQNLEEIVEIHAETRRTCYFPELRVRLGSLSSNKIYKLNRHLEKIRP